jgi:hypothetical protein
MIDPSYEGQAFPPVSYTIERNKLSEFLRAIGEDSPAYEGDDPPLPPTFATMVMFWGGGGLEGVLKQIGVDIQNVLHGEQGYEYLSPAHVGDTITGTTRINRVYERAGMQFVEFITDYVNQSQALVLTGRSLIIVRE